MKSVARWSVVVLFLVVTAGTGIVDSLTPLPMPRLVGREKASEERLRREARIADGSKARLVERSQRMRSRVRQAAACEYGFVLYRWLHEVRPTVVRGKDGWLFLKSRACPRRIIHDAALSRLASQIAVISKRLADQGSRLVMVPVPRKAVLCADRLPSWCNSQAAVDSAFVAHLTGNGVICVDLLHALRASSASPYYYKLGSHWNHKSRIVAAEEMCRVAGILAPETDRLTRILPLGQRPEDFDVLKYAGIEPNRRIKRRLAGTTSLCYRVSSPRGKAARSDVDLPILLFGSSFSNTPLPDLIHHYSTIPVERHARPGVKALDFLAKYLREAGGRLAAGDRPRTIFVELPVHSVFDGLDSSISSLLSLLPPSRPILASSEGRSGMRHDLKKDPVVD
ncbi:hypothetical protein JXA88_04535 [Candidatus Fermentibacteria bacterium]|nr:hypothetical protein [Candidatus Fermentibacteria bacterium]